jgi:hypothetical protein
MAAVPPDTCLSDGSMQKVDNRYDIAQVCGSPAFANP